MYHDLHGGRKKKGLGRKVFGSMGRGHMLPLARYMYDICMLHQYVSVSIVDTGVHVSAGSLRCTFQQSGEGQAAKVNVDDAWHVHRFRLRTTRAVSMLTLAETFLRSMISLPLSR